MKKKSDSYYRYYQDKKSGKFSYYDINELQDACIDLLEEGNVAGALELFEEGFKQHPDDPILSVLSVAYYTLDQDTEKARLLFDEIEKDGDDNTLCINYSMNILLKRTDKAIKKFFPALQDKRVEFSKWIETINTTFNMSDKSVLIPYLKKSVQYANNDHDSIATLAGMFMDAFELEAAIPLFEKALDLDAYNIDNWHDLAQCYLQTGNLEKGLEACSLGLAIDDSRTGLYFLSGLTYFFMGDPEKGQRPFEIVRERYEKELLTITDPIEKELKKTFLEPVLSQLGQCYQNKHEDEKAFQCFSRLIELFPDKADYYGSLAGCYLLKGDQNKAIELLEKALTIDPKSTKMLAVLISVLTDKKDLKKAHKYFKQLFKTDSANPTTCMAYAQFLYQTGQMDEADGVFRMILEQQPTDELVLGLLTIYFTAINDQEALNKIKDFKKK